MTTSRVVPRRYDMTAAIRGVGRWIRRVRGSDPRSVSEPRFLGSVARLMKASGCRQIRVFHGLGDMGADIVACAPDGRRLAVRCRHTLTNPAGPDIERFAGTARRLHRADIALYVTNDIPGMPSRATAQRRHVILIDRNALTVWTTLRAIPGYRPPTGSRRRRRTPEEQPD